MPARPVAKDTRNYRKAAIIAVASISMKLMLLLKNRGRFEMRQKTNVRFDKDGNIKRPRSD
jgi:hypothetical protein